MSRVRRKNKRYYNPYGKAKIKAPEQDNMEGVTVLAVFVLFLSCFYTLNHFKILDLSVLGLFKLFCFFVAITFLIPIKFYRKWLTISIYEYIILNIISLAPLFCSSFFMANEAFASENYSETYQVIDVVVDNGTSFYILENNQYGDKEYIRTIKSTDDYDFFGSDSMRITFSDGLFGVRHIKKKTLK